MFRDGYLFLQKKYKLYFDQGSRRNVPRRNRAKSIASNPINLQYQFCKVDTVYIF